MAGGGPLAAGRAAPGRPARAAPAPPPLAYEAAMGATHELALARIATGRTAELAGLEDDFLNIQLAILHVPGDWASDFPSGIGRLQPARRRRVRLPPARGLGVPCGRTCISGLTMSEHCLVDARA